MFDAAAAGQWALAKAHFTQDAYLFDGGARYDPDGILNVVRDGKQKGAAYIWKVTDPNVRFFCDTASIAYVNRGGITKDRHTTPVIWLESMMLKAAGGHWLIEFLHSTRAVSPTPPYAEPLTSVADAAREKPTR